MKKWMSLLLAGILVSAALVGCSKPEEGTDQTATTSGSDGKMESKSDEAGTPDTGAGDSKMEGAGTEGAGESKMDGEAAPPAGGESATPPAGEGASGSGDTGETK